MVARILDLRHRFVGHKLFIISFRKFVQDDCFTLSLSVSFVFLLSIIPFATLSILIVDFFQQLFFAQTNWTGQVTEMLADEMNQVIPFVSRDWMKSHVINPQAHGSFKIINFLMLPIISGLIFKTLETSYRKIFQLPARHLLFGQAVYVTMSIFAVLLIFISNFTWIIMSTSFTQLLTAINKTPYLDQIYQMAVNSANSLQINGASVLVMVGFFLATVKLFLNVKIKMRHQLLAGLIFCFLWILARNFFGFYVQNITELNLLYGSLSSVILILMWIFYSSMALLFSVEVMHVLHCGNWQYRWW
ncbi:MAG: YihY/virulence factor BrkB family protein [Desulfobacterales bacterium]|nr:YihY/virulence factor BrkB family protein [Desulfobacterales bacterium]